MGCGGSTAKSTDTTEAVKPDEASAPTTDVEVKGQKAEEKKGKSDAELLLSPPVPKRKSSLQHSTVSLDENGNIVRVASINDGSVIRNTPTLPAMPQLLSEMGYDDKDNATMKLPWTAVAAAVSSRWDFKPNDNGDDYKHVAKDGELTHSEINVLREALGLPTITDDLDDSNKFVTLVYDKLLAFAEKYKVTHTLADKEAEADASAAATTKGEEKTVVGFVFGKMSVEASAE